MTGNNMVKFIFLDVKTIHYPLILSWRSHPDIYKYLKYQTTIINWNSHTIFWSNLQNKLYKIIEFDKRPIGLIGLINTHNDSPELTILIGEISLWGKGYSKLILLDFIQKFALGKYSKLSAVININNKPSMRLFESIGFKEINGKFIDSSKWLTLQLDLKLQNNLFY